MAAGPTDLDLTNPAVKLLWDSSLMVGVAKRTPVINDDYGLIGDTENNLIQRKRDIFKEGGTRATVTLVRELQDPPLYGNEEARNREEGLRLPTFPFEINQVRKPVAMRGRITPKRVSWNVWKTTQEQLARYWAPLMESGLFLHGAGITTNIKTANERFHDGSSLANTFSNAPRTPDAAHIYRPFGIASDDLVALNKAATFDLDLVTEVRTRAGMLPLPIRPATIHGQELYVWFLHPYQVAHLKKNSRWLALMRDTIRGGEIDGSPLWRGALGIYDGVLLIESPHIPPGVDGSGVRVANVRRGIFCGAQAFVLGLAKEHSSETDFITDLEDWDYKNNKGMCAAIIAGMACPYFSVEEQGTTEDYGKIVVPTYAKELYTSA